MSTLTASDLTRPRHLDVRGTGPATPSHRVASMHPLVASRHRDAGLGSWLRGVGDGDAAALGGSARLLLAVVLVALLAATVLTTGLLGRSQADGVPVAPVTIVVQPGDTVWRLAQTHAPAGMSVGDYAWLVVSHNDVQATALRPGTILELPQH